MRVLVVKQKEKKENFEKTAKDLKLKDKKYNKQKAKVFKETIIKKDRQGNPILWY
jgi:hypothetical protein